MAVFLVALVWVGRRWDSVVGWSGAGRRKVGAQGAPTRLGTDAGLLDAPADDRAVERIDTAPSTAVASGDVSTVAVVSTLAAAGERALIACIWAQEGR